MEFVNENKESSKIDPVQPAAIDPPQQQKISPANNGPLQQISTLATTVLEQQQQICKQPVSIDPSLNNRCLPATIDPPTSTNRPLHQQQTSTLATDPLQQLITLPLGDNPPATSISRPSSSPKYL